jgi:hypothetical protein
MDMSLEVLEKFATESGNEEVVNAVSSIKESYKGNVDRLNFLEKEMKSATEKRDSVKNLVKSKLGLDELSEEALDGAINSLKGNKDSSYDAEIKNLSSMVEMLKVEKESVESKYKQTVNGFKIERALSDIGAREETEGSKAYDIVLSEIRQGAEFDDDGNIVFKANDGTTLRNADGTPVSLEDRYNQLKDSNDLAFLFKKKRSKAGSGATGSNADGAKITSLEGLDEKQRIALFKQNPEQYKRLANLS